MSKQQWSPMKWNHDFRKSIAASHALMDKGFRLLGNVYGSIEEQSIAYYRAKNSQDYYRRSHGWEIYQDGDRVVCIYDGSVIDCPEKTVAEADSIIKEAICIYEKSLPGGIKK